MAQFNDNEHASIFLPYNELNKNRFSDNVSLLGFWSVKLKYVNIIPYRKHMHCTFLVLQITKITEETKNLVSS